MRRTTLLSLAALLVLPASVSAQLTMHMSNNWTLTFSGNVHGFLVYQHSLEPDESESGSIAGGLVTNERATRIRTGLLPTFMVLDAKGKEGSLDLGVHFGLAPQIQTGRCGGSGAQSHDCFGNGTQAGAQIDMRQVYMTAGGSWGQILVGREIGLYQRQNILTDHTLFGTGATGGNTGAGGTTLGRIGFGYLYPNFNAQMTYSTPAGRAGQFSIGLFDPSRVDGDGGSYNGLQLPRLEAEATYTFDMGGGAAPAEGGAPVGGSKFMLWGSGMVQQADLNVKTAPSVDCSGDACDINSYGVAGGVKFDAGGLSLVGSGYWSSGVGSVLMFASGNAFDAAGNTRDSYGFIGQLTYALPNGKWSVGGSYGQSNLSESDEEPSDTDLLKSNALAAGILTYQATKSFRWVWEVDWTRAQSQSDNKQAAVQFATGAMLFF